MRGYHSDDVLPTPSSLNFLFHGVDSWRQSGNFPAERYNMKMTPIPRIQHMSRLNFFTKLYFMEYIKDVVIPETNKCINSDMNLSDYFRVVVCRLIIACYVDHSFRDFFLKDTITPKKGAPYASTTSSLGGALIISLRLCLTKILPLLSSMIPFSNRGRCRRG